MRVVGGVHQHAVAERLVTISNIGSCSCASMLQKTRPAAKCSLGSMLQGRGAADIADLLVHPPHPERQPAEAAFEHRQAQARMAVEHAAGEEPGHEAHRAPRVRAQPREIDIVPHVVVAGEIGRRPGEAVMRDREVVLLGGVPDRLEVGVVDRPVVVEQRLHRDRPFRGAPVADLAHRLADIAGRGDDRAFQPVGIGPQKSCMWR